MVDFKVGDKIIGSYDMGRLPMYKGVIKEKFGWDFKVKIEGNHPNRYRFFEKHEMELQTPEIKENEEIIQW
jgi:hypothetical protein